MPSNLTTGQVLPGFYGYIDFNTAGSAKAPTKRALIWGFIGGTAQFTPNVPRLPASQQEADDGCTQGSDLTQGFAAAVSQPGTEGAELWVMPIVAPSGGTASTYKLKVFVPATNPLKSGTLQLWGNSRQIPAVGFGLADTASTIATALGAAILSVKDLPIATVSVTTDTVTITYLHKGTTGEDFPFRCNISPNGCGVQLSPGQAVFSGTSGADGSVKFTFGALSVSTSIANTTTAPNIATAVAASFNADTYPLTAAVDTGSSSTVNLFFSNDKDVRRISAALITATTTTVNLGSGATDGTGSAASASTNGTVGTGAPSISAALTNLGNQDMFRSWAAPWLDVTTVGAMATNIEAASDGSINGQKQQHLTLCDNRASSVVGSLPVSTSPNLTTTAPHYAVCWSPDAPVQNLAIAARIAAVRAAFWIDTPQFNWNAYPITGSSTCPILAPASKPSADALNVALRTYALAPVVLGSSGDLEIVKGRTTSFAADIRLWSWSAEAQSAYHAIDLGIFLKSRFQGGSIVRFSEPKAPGIFDDNSIASAMQERMRFWESQGNYDGADAFAPKVKCKVNAINPNRFDLKWPESPVLDLDQIVFVGQYT